MNALSWSVGTWYEVFQSATVIIALLTAGVIAGAVITGRIVNREQSEKILVLEGANIEAQRSLEAERLTRLEMEQSLAPRILVSGSGPIKRLQRSGGTKYVLEFAPDAEAERLASLIAWVLSLSDWIQLSAVRHFDKPIRDGIAIEAKPVDGKTPVPAAELAEYLEANGLQVWTASLKNPFRLDQIPNGAVRIRIGLKPNPYFEKRFADGTVRTMKLLDALSTPGLELKELTKEDVLRLRTEWQLPKVQ
jgi:hypothetical protein